MIASDISGEALWASFGSIDAAMSTDAGMALAIRIVIAVAMWLVLFQYRIDHPDVYWTAVSLPSLGLLATWAFAGHSSSMRWPEIGVVTDVAHHAAAAAWIAGLAIVGWIVIPTTTPDVLVVAVRRFSRVAAVSVAVLVVTGLIQTVRLVGNPMDLLDADHGRYLVAKLVVLAGMLGIANVNRRRVDTAARRPGHGSSNTSGPLRQAVVAEFAIGLAIVAITAAMVVSPPSTSRDRDPARRLRPSPSYTTFCSSPRRKVPMMIRRLAAPVIAVALTATLAACGSDDTADDRLGRRDRCVIGDRRGDTERGRHRVRPGDDRPPRAGHRDGRDRARPQRRRQRRSGRPRHPYPGARRIPRSN